MVEIEEDITTLSVGLTEVDESMDFLFDEKVIQDERLLNLEEETDVIDTRLFIIDNDLDSIGNELEGEILPPAMKLWQGMFLHLSVIHSVHGGGASGSLSKHAFNHMTKGVSAGGGGALSGIHSCEYESKNCVKLITGRNEVDPR